MASCRDWQLFWLATTLHPQVYVRNKQRACEEVGFHPYEYRMNENATQEQLLDLIGVLNKDNKVNGHSGAVAVAGTY